MKLEPTDVNGEVLARGDYVDMSEAMKLEDPAQNYGIGIGQIVHIFNTGIHVRFPKVGMRTANSGKALRKVSLSAMCERNNQQ